MNRDFLKHLTLATLIAAALAGAHRLILRPALPGWERFTRSEKSAGVEKHIDHLKLTNASLVKTLDQFQKASGTKIVLDISNLPKEILLPEKWQITLDLHDLPLATLLDQITASNISSFSLRWFVQNGECHIGPGPDSNAGKPPLVRRVYDVRDILDETLNFDEQSWQIFENKTPPRSFPKDPWDEPYPRERLSRNIARAMLMDVVTSTVVADSWIDHGGTYGEATIYDGRLLITQTEDNHRQIAALLHMFRLHPNKGAQ